MATYSTNLALTLMATGEQSNTWGDTTNTNLGTLLEQAISGYVTQAITDGADTTITIPNGATGVARNMFLELTGALTATRNLIVPANKKLYFVYNATTGGFAVTVKVSGQTGVSVPNGRKVLLVSNGTDVVEAHNAISGNATVGGTLGVTGVATLGNGAILGTPASATLTNATGLPISSGVSGLGTGVATALAVNVGSAGAPVVNGGVLGTPSSGTATNLTGLPLATGVTGTLPVVNGGTGLTAGTSGGVLAYTATGTLASSAALTANSLVIGGGAGAAPSTTTTGTGVVTALGVNTGTAGAFVVNGGALGTPSSGTVTNLTGTASININGTVGATTPAVATVTTLTASADSSFTSTGAVKIPASTTANRPAGTTGQIRYNTSLNTFEGYGAASWGSIGGGATGAGGDTVFQENQLIVTTSYTLSTGKSAMSVGPITINASVAVTVPSGYRWVVL
jgi:hypothetical protein